MILPVFLHTLPRAERLATHALGLAFLAAAVAFPLDWRARRGVGLGQRALAQRLPEESRELPHHHRPAHTRNSKSTYQLGQAPRHVDLGSVGAHLPPFAFARWSAFHPDFRASLRSSAKESSVSEGQLRQRRKGRENKQSAPSKRSESLTKKSCFTLTLRSRPRQGRHVRSGASLQQAQPYRCDRSGFVNERPARKPARSAV